MVNFLDKTKAFGAPGENPRWSHSNKDGVGTAYAISSRIWFSIWNGIITEVYYPAIDTPQVRDLQFLITDGKSFLHEEKAGPQTSVRKLDPHVLGYSVIQSDPQGRYTIEKDVISSPHLPCLLVNTKFESQTDLQLYALCAPHLEVGGWGNDGHIIEVSGKKYLAAHKGDTWLVMGATIPFKRLSCGYVGQSDGWQDLQNFKLDWVFDEALDGNIALTGQLDLEQGTEFTIALAFGTSIHNAISHLLQSLEIPFSQQKQEFHQQWNRVCQDLLPLQDVASDQGRLFHSSYSLLLAHEDKSYPGAMIASLAIPWGADKSDSDKGGYHLVWTRDLVSSSSGLIAAGQNDTAVRSLIYLATTQREDGGFAQNFWLDGEAYWTGIQLDEVAFPILLAWKLHKQNALTHFDILPMVTRAAGYLIRHGPVTEQERWEENSGYSPATLASTIAALVCAGQLLRERGEQATALFVEDYADFLEGHIEAWTVTTEGTLVPEIQQHYIRLTPAEIDDPHPTEDPNSGILNLTSRPPGEQSSFPAKNIVSGGFLQLVRYGIRKADDPIIVNSVKVIDQVLKTETPSGPGWHRYNHDGYGQREDGGPYDSWGTGRIWPLLTGERGHYELALGGDVAPYIQAMEQFATETGLLPEQSWDETDQPDQHLYLGRPTGSAMPLMWAHAEYIKLLRSVKDSQVYDFIPEVARRYLDRYSEQNGGDSGVAETGSQPKPKFLEVWKFNRQVRSVKPNITLRIQTLSPFQLRWSINQWQTAVERASQATDLGIYYADIDINAKQVQPIEFTFFWIDSERWEQRNYNVSVKQE